MKTRERLPVGTRIIDRDGFAGAIRNITDHEGRFWYDVQFERGQAVRYPSDVRVVIDDYPAYAIVDEKKREYRDGEKIAVPFQSRNHGKLYSFYKLGSVEAEARKEGRDVEAAIAREKSIGGKLYYAFGLGASLTAWERPKEIVPGFEIGETIFFEGKRFTIERAPNNNINLVEFSEPVAKVYSETLRLEAALCIWEAMLDARFPGEPAEGEDLLWANVMDETWAARGSVQMRHTAIDLADKALETFDLIGGSDGAEELGLLPYDWEFIPAFVGRVDWTDCTADPAAIAASLKERAKGEAA